MKLTSLFVSLLAFTVHVRSSEPLRSHMPDNRHLYNNDVEYLNITVAGKRNFTMSDAWNFSIFCNGSLPIYLKWCFEQISSVKSGGGCSEANLTLANKIDLVHKFQAAGTYQMIITAIDNDFNMASIQLYLLAAPPGLTADICNCNYGWLLAIFVIFGGSIILVFSVLQILRYQRSNHQVETADFDFTPTHSGSENSSSFGNSRERLSSWWQNYSLTSSSEPWRVKYKKWMSPSNKSSSHPHDYGTFVEMKETKPV